MTNSFIVYRRLIRYTYAIIAFAGTMLVRPVAAQTVAGNVRDAVSGLPVRDATLALVDSTGRRVAATLVDADGRYLLGAPAPGRYRVQVRRIGYASTVSPPLALGVGARLAYEVRAGRVPVALTPVRLRARSACLSAGAAEADAAGDTDAARATRLWQEARKALDATDLAVRGRRLIVTVRDTRATYALGAGRPRAVEADERTGAAASPYAAPDPATLATRGFVQVRDGAVWFYAPDAAVLVSDAFAATYCLREASGPPPIRGLVGIGFAPASDRTPGVRGVLWMDPATGALHTLTFAYVALPDVVGQAERSLPRQALGGRVDFAAVPGAGWMVRRWSVRVPVMERRFRTAIGAAADGGPGGDWSGGAGSGLVAVAIQEVAGEVLRAARPDGTEVWRAGVATLAGTVQDSASGRAVGGVPVALTASRAATGSWRTTRTDSAGRWAFAGLPPGVHAVTAGPAPGGTRPVTEGVTLVEGDAAHLDLRLPPSPPAVVTGAPSCLDRQRAADDEVAAALAPRALAVVAAAAGRSQLDPIAVPDGRPGGGAGAERDDLEALRTAPVIVRVAVDTTGRPEMGTFRVVRSAGVGGDAVARDLVRGLQLPVASPGPGCRTRQVVTIPLRLRRAP